MTSYLIDCETTGVTTKDQIIELASIKLPANIHNIVHDDFLAKILCPVQVQSIAKSERFNPSVPINPHAQKVHGISKLRLVGCRHSKYAQIPSDLTILIAHNAQFDIRMLGAEDVKYICTMNLAKKIEKLQGGKFGFENYKLFTMLCFFYPQHEELFRTEQHNALIDCRMTVLVLIALLKSFPFLTTLEEVESYFYSTI